MSGMFRRETATEPEVKDAGRRPRAWKMQHLLGLPEPGRKMGKKHLPGLLVCLAPSVFSVYRFCLICLHLPLFPLVLAFGLSFYSRICYFSVASWGLPVGSSFCLLCLDATCKVFLLWFLVLTRQNIPQPQWFTDSS